MPEMAAHASRFASSGNKIPHEIRVLQEPLMSNFFVFSNLQSWKSGDFPANAFISIKIAEHVALPTGELLISAQLATEGEIDDAVDGLIADLEKIRRAAKTRIKADNARVRNDVTKRIEERGE